MTQATRSADVVVVGGGLVGTALVNALARLPLDVVLLEARPPGRFEEPGFDGRSTALANVSQRILEQLGLWADGADAEPIRSIHVGERGRFGAARIHASEEHVAALGYTIENAVLAGRLWRALSDAPRLECLAPARVLGVDTQPDQVRVEVDNDGRNETIGTRLLVAADGADSHVRGALGIDVSADDYGQRAVVANCATEVRAAGRAFERFTAQGPLAVLPLTRGRVAVIWTSASDAAERIAGLDDAAFARELQQAFGHRLGRITKVGARSAFALSRVRSERVLSERCVLVGNAALSLHPVAGQSFNLALRDSAALAEVIAEHVAAHGAGADVGLRAPLERYERWRRADQRKVASFTHGLVRLFGVDWPGFGVARGLGLLAFDLAPGAKRLLARHTMGMAGRLPRLARGLDLPGATRADAAVQRDA